MDKKAFKKLFVFLLLISSILRTNAQITDIRLNENQLKRIKQINTFLSDITQKTQDALNRNKAYLAKLAENSVAQKERLNDIHPYLLLLRSTIQDIDVKKKDQRLIDSVSTAIAAYKEEFRKSIDKKNMLAQKKQDKIDQEAIASKEAQRGKERVEEAERNEERQERIEEVQNSNPYSRLENNLDGISKIPYGQFTVFTGLELNFVNIRFSRFLQDSFMRLSPIDESDVITDEYFFQKYISRVSSGSSPYLTIKYYTKSVTDKVPYLPTDNGESRIITKVEIEGTTDLIVRLFVKYWNYNFEAGGRKSGAIANYQIMGDNIILKSTDRINISKIVIGEGAIKGFDYYSTFKIQN